MNLPDISATGPELRRRIYKERRVELAFENHRFFDVRRWKIADDVENRAITTLDVYRNMSTGVKRYQKVVLTDRAGKFKEQMNLLPVSRDEIQRNPKLTQTPGWAGN